MTNDIKNSITLTSNDVSKEICLGFEWFRAERKLQGRVHDIDVCAIILNRDGKISRDADFVFYNNRSDPAHIVYFSDNYESGLENWDDSININLTNATSETGKIIILTHLYDATRRKQDFSQLTAFYMYNDFEMGMAEPVVFTDLPSTELMLLCEIKLVSNKWVFVPTGIGYSEDLQLFLKEHGLNLE